MAIVKEMTTANGAKIFFHDDAYAGCSDEQLRQRVREIQRTAWWCWARAAERKKGENHESDTVQALPG